MVPLEAAVAHRDAAGAKAWSLAELARAGFAVPPGFVVTTAALEAYLEETGLAFGRELLSRSVMGPQLSRFRAALLEAPWPASLRALLLASLRQWLPGVAPLAVRSSGTHEDLEGHSFAGVYRTVLGVTGEEAVLDAVRACWASLWDEGASVHLRRAGAGGASMAVIVQQQVLADASGVLFTVAPDGGSDGEALLEMTAGSGEALVSGRVRPWRFRLDRRSGEVRSREVGDGPALELSGPGELAQLAARVQAHFGRPVDLELAHGGGRWTLLQARPITALALRPPDGPWTTANLREGNVAAGECSPLMASLYESAFDDSMRAYLLRLRLLREEERPRICRSFFGRPYWNVGEVKRAGAKIPGFNERAFDEDLGIAPSYEGDGRAPPLTARSVLGALPTVLALQWSYGAILRQVRRFHRGYAARAQRWKMQGLDALPDGALAAGLREVLASVHEPTERLYLTCVYALSNAKLELSLSLNEARRRGTDPSYARLIGGLGGVSHVRLGQDLEALAAPLRARGGEVDEASVDELIARWPHRGPREMDLRVPRWGDDRHEARRALAEAVASGGAVGAAGGARGQPEHERERARVMAALPLVQRALFALRLSRARSLAWWREEMRDRSLHAYWLVRRWLVEAGRRLAEQGALDAAGDVFSLRAAEVVEALEGRLAPAQVRARVADRLREGRGFAAFDAPAVLGARAAVGERRVGPGAHAGAACSPGQARGLARVVRTFEEARSLRAGEILVAPFADPAWTALLCRAGALVTDSGGLLSHAAVIARELGVPAVLGAAGVTGRIRTGDLLQVDGTAGLVEVVRPC